MGQGGRGAVALAGLQHRVFAVVGTCGKAMGSYGAFAAGHAPLRAWLWNRSRPFVYSTALPPATCAATLAALDLLEQGEAQDRLRQIRMAMTHALSRVGLWSGPVPEGAVFPVVIGDADRTMRVSAALAERGFFVQGIRQPTVPAGTSRLRLTVNAGITEVQVNAMVDALVHALQQTGVDATKVVQTG
jgi:7-keto-8-aminopelargonate synthetase-like enzyme